jgi:hypothetical protein
LLVLGQLDIIVDLPPAPEGAEILSRADEMTYGLDVPVASYILPENMVWWRLDRRGWYVECLVREVQDDTSYRWRYWSADRWALYDATGEAIGPPVDHPYGRVPIVRVFDRKRPRHRNIGMSRYEAIAELMLDYYNKDSELILSDTLQAHPLLQAPMDLIKPDGTIPVGPNFLLPMFRVSSGTSVAYQGFEVVEFPKGGADSIRTNKHDLRDAADRAACLTKPAGVAGTQGQTVSQSGVSKQLDQSTGNDLLGQLAKTLEKCEDAVSRLYWLVASQGDPDPADLEATTIQYPTEFDLFTAPELAALIAQIQTILNIAGTVPEVEAPLIQYLVRLALPGKDDDEYALMDAAIEKRLNEPPEPTEPTPSPDGQSQGGAYDEPGDTTGGEAA